MSRLQEIRERLEAATPGPWEAYSSNDDYPPVTHSVVTESHGDLVAELNPTERASLREGPLSSESADAWFIAHSRGDVEALLGAVEGVLAYVDACIDNDTEVDAPVVKWFIEKMLQEKEK